MSDKPFAESDVLWRWQPTPEDRPERMEGLDEVVIVKQDNYVGGFTVWGRSDWQWAEGYVNPFVVRELVRQVDEQNKELEAAKAENGWLKDQAKNNPDGPRGVMCIYCGNTVVYEPSEGIQAAIDAAAAHDVGCERNPLVKKIVKLTEELETANELLRLHGAFKQFIQALATEDQRFQGAIDRLESHGGGQTEGTSTQPR